MLNNGWEEEYIFFVEDICVTVVRHAITCQDPLHTLNYIVFVVLYGDTLRLMINIRHGDATDTSERETEGRFW